MSGTTSRVRPVAIAALPSGVLPANLCRNQGRSNLRSKASAQGINSLAKRIYNIRSFGAEYAMNHYHVALTLVHSNKEQEKDYR